MTASEYRAALDRLGLTQVRAAPVLDVSPRTAQYYASSGPSGPAGRLMALLLELPVSDAREWIVRHS